MLRQIVWFGFLALLCLSKARASPSAARNASENGGSALEKLRTVLEEVTADQTSLASGVVHIKEALELYKQEGEPQSCVCEAPCQAPSGDVIFAQTVKLFLAILVAWAALAAIIIAVSPLCRKLFKLWTDLLGVKL